MQAQTYLDVQRGLKYIGKAVDHVTFHGHEDEISTETGALALLANIEAAVEAIREVVQFDSAVLVLPDGS